MNNELMKYLNLKEELKLDSKYAEIINIITIIISFTILCMLPQFISTINTISVMCLFYLISKLLNFMMFGSRLKRVKERRNIKLSINSLN